jgi:hypothetical protein
MATDQINVTTIPFKRPTKPAKATSNTVNPAKAHSSHWNRAMHRQSLSATGIGLAIIVLTSLSLSHLASGISIITHSPAWQGWALAIGIDLGFMELACVVTVADKVRKVVERYARPAIVGTLTGSAVLNAFAFAGAAETLTMQIAGSVMGCAVPGLIYCLTRIASAQYIDCHSRQ